MYFLNSKQTNKQTKCQYILTSRLERMISEEMETLQFLLDICPSRANQKTQNALICGKDLT